MAVHAYPQKGQSAKTTDWKRYHFWIENGVWNGLESTIISASQRTIQVKLGVAVANGTVFVMDADETIVIPAQAGTYYIYIQPTIDNTGSVTGVQLKYDTNATAYASEFNTPICSVVISGGSASNLVDGRIMGLRLLGDIFGINVDGRAFGYRQSVGFDLVGLSAAGTTGEKDYMVMRRAGKLYGPYLTARTAPTGNFVVDIHKNGSTILDTNKLKLTNNQTKGVEGIFTDDAYATGDVITFEVDTAQSAARGVKIWLEYMDSE